jgi:nitrogen fixation NifU-like protein
MDDLYREQIIERYKNPQYRGHLEPYDIQLRMTTRCAVTILNHYSWAGTIVTAAFQGKGCAISRVR